MEALAILTSLAVVLVVGTLAVAIAARFKMPSTLLLLAAGIGLSYITYQGNQLVSFPQSFFTSIALLAVALIVFEGAASMKLRELDTFSLKAIKLAGIFILLNIAAITFAGHFLIGLDWFTSLIFAALVSNTNPGALTVLFKNKKASIIELLKLESMFSIPLSVILVFVLIELQKNVMLGSVSVPGILFIFFNKIIAGVGTGVLMALILFKLLQERKKKGRIAEAHSGHSSVYAAIAVLVAAILTFVLAENIGGSGGVAIVALGVLFGALRIKHKLSLLKFESIESKLIFILLFVLVGLMIQFPVNLNFILISLGLFIIHLLARYFAVSLSVKVPFKERMFITMNSAKGVETVALILLVAIYSLPGSEFFIPGSATIVYLGFAFLIYSIVLSTVFSSIFKIHLEHSA
jgi:cell volume regulation protein A